MLILLSYNFFSLLVVSKFEEPAMRRRVEGYGAEWIRADDPDKSPHKTREPAC